VKDELSAELIRSGLTTRYVGKNAVYYASVGSTNTLARDLAEQGAAEGTVVVAGHQTSGRGRLGRRWEAPRDSSLLMSLLFRPTLRPDQVQQLTMICGLAVLDAIEAETGVNAGLKWPNDIIWEGAKLGGILTEVGLCGIEVEYLVVGIGINVNLDPAQLPEDLRMPATSVSQILGAPVPRLSLTRRLLAEIERRYDNLRAGHLPLQEWSARLATLGSRVAVSTEVGIVAGRAESVDGNGALLVRLDDGRLQKVVAGDVDSPGSPSLAALA